MSCAALTDISPRLGALRLRSLPIRLWLPIPIFRLSRFWRRCQEIEAELGRDREAEQREKELSGQNYASRVIDIDILLYDDEIVDTDTLKIPHPRMTEREFVLTPLCEVMRGRKHPVAGLTMGELREKLQKTL